MTSSEAKTVRVSDPVDVISARRAARELASVVGFDDVGCAEVALAVSELASNVAKHAGAGTLMLTASEREGEPGTRIVVEDDGPGIEDPEGAVADGFSTAGSLGAGLGAVHRLMDEFDIVSSTGSRRGTRVTCSKWVRRNGRRAVGCPLDLAAASRHHPGMQVNGDAFVIQTWGQSALVAVIDGLGHGAHAHRASRKAQQFVETHRRLPMQELFLGVGRACRGTRGVVMAVAHLDWAAERLTFASVGNIEARVFGPPDPVRLAVRRGVIGHNAPAPVVFEGFWAPRRDTLILFSDGISSRWGQGDFPDAGRQTAQAIAGEVLRRMARDDDDATVLVVKGLHG